jgi:uncharacterized protein YheU (UPF0270 family)
LGDWWEDDRERPPPVAVPHTELSEEALRGVVESFVLREGTDYGERDVSHESKVGDVMRQLQRGEARILFDPLDSSVTIVVVGPDSRVLGRDRKASSVGQTRASRRVPPEEDV